LGQRSGGGKALPDIPLFPLNLVLMPGAPQALHVFEERYKQMVNECLDESSEFGMILADESGTRKVGCTAKIVELVRRYDDGRMVILVEGSRRFRLNNIMTGKPYYVGEVDYLEDGPEEDVSALAEECVALLERVVEAATEGSVGIEIEPPLPQPVVRHRRPHRVRPGDPPEHPGTPDGTRAAYKSEGTARRGGRTPGTREGRAREGRDQRTPAQGLEAGAAPSEPGGLVEPVGTSVPAVRCVARRRDRGGTLW
jgi:hypothetical protein